ncbi:MAG: hypothetical protein E6X17_06845 [Sporomusaceae bacterium]|nr:hypothetical protein [Sporomusaceae bacterium]
MFAQYAQEDKIEVLALTCNYKDCAHMAEPGCAVKAAVAAGPLSASRFESYLKLQREIAYQGLASHQLEQEKINRMFGSKGKMKQFRRQVKTEKR